MAHSTLSHTEHVKQLVDEFGIHLVYHASPDSWGYALASPGNTYRWSGWNTRRMNGYPNKQAVHTFPAKTIIVPPPWRNVDAYWTCLHEIGHIAMNHTPKKYRRDIFKCEMEAWTWAFEHSIHPLSRKYLNEVNDFCLMRHSNADWDKRIYSWYAKSERFMR